MLSVLSTQVGEIPVSEFGLGTYFRPMWTHVSIPGTSLGFYLAQSMEGSENTLKRKYPEIELIAQLDH